MLPAITIWEMVLSAKKGLVAAGFSLISIPSSADLVRIFADPLRRGPAYPIVLIEGAIAAHNHLSGGQVVGDVNSLQSDSVFAPVFPQVAA